MKWRYRATKEDLKAIKEGIEIVWSGKLNHIFEDKNLIENTNVLSFDSDFLFLWMRQKQGGWKLKKIKHEISFNQKDQSGWQAGLLKNKMYQYLPKLKKNNFAICGSLLFPFLNAHKTKNSFDAYSTRMSYLATIVHEFAHTYYKNFIYNNFCTKTKNVSFLQTALRSSFRKRNKEELKIYLPLPSYLGEIFAFCVEYETAEIFFPKHKKNIDRSDGKYIKYCLDQENKRKTGYIPIFEKHDDHLMAMVFGRILLEKYPKIWEKKILEAMIMV
ncbi:hypothetical protein KJ909_01255 [Patescibacteria group bacterium]|nr:hypothetical protein [Patescibacteria group bacterium]